MCKCSEDEAVFTLGEVGTGSCGGKARKQHGSVDLCQSLWICSLVSKQETPSRWGHVLGVCTGEKGTINKISIYLHVSIFQLLLWSLNKPVWILQQNIKILIVALTYIISFFIVFKWKPVALT